MDTETPQAPHGVIKSVTLGWILIVTSALGLVASFELTLQRIAQIEDPNHVANCDINAIISCGSVMKSPEAELFGFPNSLLGLACFGAILAAGGALVAGGKFKPYFWYALLAGQLGGLVMVHWLMGVSMLLLHMICPWCVVTWFATIPAFCYTLIYAISSGALGNSPKTQEKATAIGAYHPVIVGGWLFLLMLALVAEYLLVR